MSGNDWPAIVFPGSREQDAPAIHLRCYVNISLDALVLWLENLNWSCYHVWRTLQGLATLEGICT